MVAAPLPWDAAESFRERTLDKNDGAGLRRHLERYYSITGKDRIEDALLCYAGDHKIHPVKDYLLSLKWDGTPRLDTLFIDYFGAEDNVYNRAVARKSFTAAVARVMEPGTKKDEMTVLIGEQGTGKSTLLRTLGKAWYSNGIKSFDGKNAAELLQGVWISEIEEMSAYRRGEINLIKSFVSTSEDHYREAYASRAGKYPRQCVFFGTTNSDEFLRDDTGERRFWPVKLGVKKATKSVFKDLKNDVDQLWAEAYLRYLLGESLILAGEARKAATIYQDEFSVKSPREGLILDFLDKDIPKNWDKLAAPQRLLFLKSEFNADAAELEKRVKVSALEVYLECFGGDIKSCKTSDIQEINAVIRKTDAWEYRSIRTIYGTAKGWARKNA
jgi:predicted P-loop ATPase